jgi:hypothetical protein
LQSYRLLQLRSVIVHCLRLHPAPTMHRYQRYCMFNSPSSTVVLFSEKKKVFEAMLTLHIEAPSPQP